VHRLSVERDDELAIVRAEGELDAYAAPDVADAFREAADARRVVADLSAVSFLDSTALGVIVKALRELGDDGGAARVVLPGGPARRIFEITTLDRVLPISANRADAVAELSA
jgi:anti-sigma B factor antagonist